MGGQEFSQTPKVIACFYKPICPPIVKVLVNIHREITWSGNNKSARTTGTFIIQALYTRRTVVARYERTVACILCICSGKHFGYFFL